MTQYGFVQALQFGYRKLIGQQVVEGLFIQLFAEHIKGYPDNVVMIKQQRGQLFQAPPTAFVGQKIGRGYHPRMLNEGVVTQRNSTFRPVYLIRLDGQVNASPGVGLIVPFGIPKNVKLAQIQFVKPRSLLHYSLSCLIDRFRFSNKPTRQAPFVSIAPAQQEYLELVFVKTENYPVDG